MEPRGASLRWLQGVMLVPDYFDVYSLRSKQITGAGLEPRVWNYTYRNNGSVRATGTIPCETCRRDKQVIVEQPDKSVVHYTFGVQMATANGTMGERFSQVSWARVGVATAAGALSGGVSAIASTAATTGGTIAANVIGNAAVGAVASHAGAQVDGRAASVSEVLMGAAVGGAASGIGASISAAPGVAARSASAGMSSTERHATGSLMQGIKEATPGFSYTNPIQTGANAFGNGVSAAGELRPLLEEKKK
jgi:hypothetical protein